VPLPPLQAPPPVHPLNWKPEFALAVITIASPAPTAQPVAHPDTGVPFAVTEAMLPLLPAVTVIVSVF